MLRNYLFLLILSLFACTAIAFGQRAYAQFAAPADPIRFIIAPTTPGPNTKVQMQVQGIGSFLGNSLITWRKDGAQASVGIGKTTFSFITGGVGTATKIDVTIESSKGTYTRSYIFAPSIVEFLWEADSYTPLFYAGKPLMSPGSRLKIIAFPSVASGRELVPPSKLSFQWSLNSALVPVQSGLGKNVFYLDSDILHNSQDVALDIYLSGTQVAHGDISVPTTDPMVLMYNKDPLRGEVLDQALPATFGLGSNEITIQAEPYYFANTSKQAGLLSYRWTLNNQDTTGPDTARGILTLRQTGRGSGAASIGVTVQNSDANSLVQSAQAALNILFGAQTNTTSSSLFGL